MSQRAFRVAAGTTAAVAGLLMAATAILATDLVDASSAEQTGSIACPRGLVNDRYPGKCRLYVDTTGDGFCDYSAEVDAQQLLSTVAGGSQAARPHSGPTV